MQSSRLVARDLAPCKGLSEYSLPQAYNRRQIIIMTAFSELPSAPSSSPLGSRKWKGKKLRYKAAMLAIALSMLPVFVIGSVAYTFASKAIFQQVTRDQRLYSKLAGSQIDSFLVSRLRDLEVLALNPVLTQSGSNTTKLQQQKEIDRFFETVEYFDSLVIFDLDGNPILQKNLGNPLRGNYSDYEYFQAALRTGKPAMNGPGLSKSSGKLRVEFAVPIKDQQTGEILFIIRARIPGHYINQLFTLLEEKGHGWYLVNESGTIFAGSNTEHLSRRVHVRVPSAVGLVERHQESSGIFKAHADQSHSRAKELLSYVPIDFSAEIPERQLGLITYSNTRISLVSQRRLAVTFAVGTVLTGLIAAAVALLLTKRISRPIEALTSTTRTISQEARFDLRVPVTSDDELGSLASSFNQLIEWIGSRTQALEASQIDLEQRTQELSAIINSLGDGLLVTDNAGFITRCNPPLLKMFAQTEAAVRERPAQAVFADDLNQLIARCHREPGAVLSHEIQLANQAIGQALVSNIIDPETGNSLGCVVLIRDITAEKEVDRMKTDFISTVSHELRTPLTSVLGFAKIIQKKMDTVLIPAIVSDDKKTKRALRQVRDNLKIIVSEGDRLTTLINDVLDIAKIESGKLEWRMAEVDPQVVVEKAIAATSILASDNNITLTAEIAPDLPKVFVDQDRLIQVIINLISNAVKFTDEGSVTCEVKTSEDELRINVIDTGIGIREEDQAKVFEKFKQVGEIMTDKPQGTGLGLPICKRIVEHLGGRIWVESQLNVGSTFSIALPLALSSGWVERRNASVEDVVNRLKADVRQTAPAEAGNAKTILVVDDENNIRSLLRQELESEGYSVEEAKDGVAAIEIAKRVLPDLIITDVMMPHLDGFDLTAVLRTNPLTASIPAIMLSIVEDRDRGFRLGIDRYLTKPIDTAVLLDTVESLLKNKSARSKVLIVNRDTSTSRTLTDVLLSKGYVVAAADSGQEGLDKARSLKPDMMIVDAQLSKEHNIVKTLRFEKGLEHISVILMESVSMKTTL